MNKPAVFIGSSTEGLKVARAIRDQLNDDALITIWNEDENFKPGRSTLGSLMIAVKRYDFAILVFTADDEVTSRGAVSLAPRDNVLFELGLFMGHLDRERTFIVYNKKDNVKIPSDFQGINCPVYESRSDNLTADLGRACNKIRQENRQARRFSEKLVVYGSRRSLPDIKRLHFSDIPRY